jgi:hypothetical protein
VASDLTANSNVVSVVSGKLWGDMADQLLLVSFAETSFKIKKKKLDELYHMFVTVKRYLTLTILASVMEQFRHLYCEELCNVYK